MAKYYTFDLPLEAGQIRKMKDAWDECIGPEPAGAGLFCFVNFKTGLLRGMIMPQDVCGQFKPTLMSALAGAQKDDMGSI